MTTKQGENKSNEKLRQENLAKLQQYLAGVERVPERRSEANLSAIAAAANVRRAWLYDDEPNAIIRAAVAAKGLGMPQQQRAPGGDSVPALAAQRIKSLEEQLAVIMAETRDLRARLRRYEHLEQHMTETGRLAR
jgi:hypothetical protein